MNVYLRYLFPPFVFKDAGKGSIFERAAALKYNKEHRDWLMLYTWRWIAIAGISWMFGRLWDLLNVDIMTNLAYAISCCSLTLGWLWLVLFWILGMKETK